MLKGSDISHWNGKFAVENIIQQDKDISFFMIKATEGKTFVDPLMEYFYYTCESFHMLKGFYHYARPDNNTALEDALNFVVAVQPFIGDCILALDWEDKAFNYPISWALDWLNAVYEMTGVKPLFYCQSSKLLIADCIAESDYGLWVAEWNGGNAPSTKGKWNAWAMWQSTNRPNDIDWFNGNREQWMKYCEPVEKKNENITEKTDSAGCCCCCCCCKRKSE